MSSPALGEIDLRAMAKDNHHYVPQGYLRGFTIEEEKSLIWEYDKNTGVT